MRWEELSWPQIETLDKEKVVVIPTGSVEQHGRHLPVFTDTFLVTDIAQRVAERMGDEIILLPTLWLGSSNHHRDYPGTLSISAALYSKVIKGLTMSILQAKFRRLFFLIGHGGNAIPIAQALADLSCESELANAAWLASATYWGLADDKIGVPQGLTQEKLAHSCEFETSMLFFVRPELVAQAKIESATRVIDDEWWNPEWGGKVSVFKRFNRLTASGAMGLPEKATPEKGRALLDVVIQEVVRFLRDFAKWPDASVRKV